MTNVVRYKRASLPHISVLYERVPVIWKERASRGAARLDAETPDWYRPYKIDLNRLEMANGGACILGQLDGGFDLGAEKRGFSIGEGLTPRHKVVTHGFIAPEDSWSSIDLGDMYFYLNVAWRYEILTRRQRDTEAVTS